MSSLPELTNYRESIESLRQATRVLGQVRAQGHEPMKNHLQWATKPTPYGLSTGHLENGYELQLHFIEKKITFVENSEEVFSIELEGSSQEMLVGEVFRLLNEHGVNYQPEENKENASNPFVFDDLSIKNYLATQTRVQKTLDTIRGQLKGNKTPVVVWPHGFDLSFLWFKEGEDEQTDSHMIFGFSPGLSDDEPYLYSYAWPTPDGFVGSDLPPGASWERDWPTPGAKIPYSSFAGLEDPEEFIQEALLSLFERAEKKL